MRCLSLLSDEEMAARLQRVGRPVRPATPYDLLFPEGLVQGAHKHLWDNGSRGLEQLALWAGYPTAAGVVLASLLMPATEAEPQWVHILPEEQPQIAGWVRERGQLLFVESHTHADGPYATELSEEDRRHPAGRQDGFLTLIVTGYGRRGIDLPTAGVWECRSLAYEKLAPAEAVRRLRMVSDQEARDALV